MKIKNSDNLSQNNLRKKALAIAEAGLLAIDTKKVVRERIRFESDTLFVNGERFPLKDVEDVFVVGVGKCAAASAVVLEEILGERITDGVVIDVSEPPKLERIEFFQGTHPFPSETNKRATDKTIELLKRTDENDFVIFVISGGGSTLLRSSGDISPEEEKKMVEELFKVGAVIEEINTIRKHISIGRGGNLAKYAYPARGFSLIFSDVPANDFQFIASGPTVKDETTIEMAEEILAKYDVLNKCRIGSGLMQTPKDDKYFKKLENILFVSNKTALKAMEDKASELGFKAKICGNCLTGEAGEMGKNTAIQLHNEDPGTALLYGGETTVTIKGSGKGGRNQELVLSALQEINDGELILSVASDGRDNTEHAGALCDKITLRKALELGFDPKDYLNQNDSFTFFKETGDYIETGNTGSNVSDLLLAIKNNE